MTDQKTNSKTFKAEEVLEKLNYWYKIVDFYLVGSNDASKAKKDFHYMRDAILHFNGDKQADHARFAKMFKKLFDKKNKELAEEIYETKKELFKEKQVIKQLEKELEDKEDD